MAAPFPCPRTYESKTMSLPVSIPGPLIAHRGASAHAPENTLPALAKAREMGCGWVEIDAQVTRDGGCVLMHDEKLNRTTDGAGPLANQTLAALAELDAGSHFSPDYAGTPIPSLAEAIETCLEIDLGLVLEIKVTWGLDLEDAEAVAEVVNKSWPRDNHRLLVTSFSAFGLMAFSNACPWARTGLAVLAPPADPQRVMDRVGNSAFHLNAPYVTAENLRRTLDAGADVAVATVNDAEAAQAFLDMGAHAVMTDQPALLAAG